MLIHESGATEGWQSYFISGKADKVRTFDVAECSDGIFVATIIEPSAAEACVTKYATLKPDEPGQEHRWATVPDNQTSPVGDLDMTSILVRAEQDPNSPKSLVIGTGSTLTKAGTFYEVSTDYTQSNPWKKRSFPAAAGSVKQTEQLILKEPDEQGMLSVFDDGDASGRLRCVGHIFAPKGGVSRNFEVKAGRLNGVNSVSTFVNPYGYVSISEGCHHDNI